MTASRTPKRDHAAARAARGIVPIDIPAGLAPDAEATPARPGRLPAGYVQSTVRGRLGEMFAQARLGLFVSAQRDAPQLICCGRCSRPIRAIQPGRPLGIALAALSFAHSRSGQCRPEAGA